jgi:glycosyltransferase involved in cell wall biosynthesis
MDMRIKMYGGALTISYNIAKFLKERGIDVTLYVDADSEFPSYNISWEDEDLKKGYPPWVKQVDVRLNRIMAPGANEKSFLKELSDCDLLHMHGEGALWASFTDRPYLYQSYGYDLDQMPFKFNDLRAIVLAQLCRRAVKKSDFIIIAPHQTGFAKRLGVDSKAKYVPYPVDCGKYRKVDSPLRTEILKGRACGLLLFHPTRQEWLSEDTNNKGNDRLMRAFKIFSARSGKKPVLVMIEKGRDLPESKRLCRELGIDKDVIWLKEVDKKRLIELYSVSDVMLDQFTLGSFGLIVLEAMSCSLPVFAYVKGYESCYDDPLPVVSAKEPEDIAEKLLDITENKERLASLGSRTRQWVVKYHNKDVGITRYIDIYNSILEKSCIHT